jgi:DDE superfamily endonuclease
MNTPNKAWTQPGEKRIGFKVKHPQKVHAWGCFSAQGFGKLFLFTQNLDANLMAQIYEKALLPYYKALSKDSLNSWFLLEDNDPKHTSKIAQAWKVKNTIQSLPFPASSPDLNPIENVWALLKNKISKYRVTSIRGLKTKIKLEWNKLEQELAYNLAISMSKRLSKVIINKGNFVD